MHSVLLNFQPRRSLTHGNIVAIEICNRFGTANESNNGFAATLEEFLAKLEAVIIEFTKWHQGSLHGIPVSITLPDLWILDSRLLEALVCVCEKLSLPHAFIEVALIPTNAEPINPQCLHSFKQYGFHTKLSFPWGELPIEATDVSACDVIDIALTPPDGEAVDMGYLSKIEDFLTQARINGINTVARDIRCTNEYDAIVDCGLFTDGVGDFFWPPQSPQDLLRNELTFSRFFTTGWKQHKGRFIPTNPLYFQPWKGL